MNEDKDTLKQLLAKTCIIYKAMKKAIEVHDGQEYGNDIKLPYAYHLDSVSKIILNFFPYDYPNKTELMAAAWLHDSVEDFPEKISFEDVENEFGKTIKDIVYLVTDQRDENNNVLPRKERAKNLINRLKNKDDGIIVKLADRIANTEYSLMVLEVGEDNNKFEMYKKEYDLFRKGLFSKDQNVYIKDMWRYLDSLFGIENKEEDYEGD